MNLIDGAQIIPNCVKTELVGLPGVYVYQQSGAHAWAKTYGDGSILLSPLDDGETWRVYPKEDVGE